MYHFPIRQGYGNACFLCSIKRCESAHQKGRMYCPCAEKAAVEKPQCCVLSMGLHHIFMLENYRGAVRVHGMDIPSSDLPKISRFVGSVFQNPRTQFFHMDTTGEMAFNLENQNMPREKMKKRLEEVAYHLHLEELLERDILNCPAGKTADRLWLCLCVLARGGGIGRAFVQSGHGKHTKAAKADSHHERGWKDNFDFRTSPMVS